MRKVSGAAAKLEKWSGRERSSRCPYVCHSFSRTTCSVPHVCHTFSRTTWETPPPTAPLTTHRLTPVRLKHYVHIATLIGTTWNIPSGADGPFPKRHGEVACWVWQRSEIRGRWARGGEKVAARLPVLLENHLRPMPPRVAARWSSRVVDARFWGVTSPNLHHIRP